MIPLDLQSHICQVAARGQAAAGTKLNREPTKLIQLLHEALYCSTYILQTKAAKGPRAGHRFASALLVVILHGLSGLRCHCSRMEMFVRVTQSGHPAVQLASDCLAHAHIVITTGNLHA